MPTTVKTIIEGLNAAFSTVLNNPRDHAVLDHFPTALHKPITLISELSSFKRGEGDTPSRGQVVPMRYRIAHYLLVRLQDNATAEDEILSLINNLCAAVDADSRLGGRLNGGTNGELGGIAHISDGQAGFIEVGDKAKYRVLTFYSDVLHKFAYKTPGL